MEIAIEHKPTNKRKVFKLGEEFYDVPVSELIIHIGMDTYTLKTTKTEEEIDLERRLDVFGKEEFDKLAKEFPEFGDVVTDTEQHKELVSRIQIRLEEVVKSSNSLKDVYDNIKDKEKTLRQLMYSFTNHVSLIRGVEKLDKTVKERRLHKCFPMDFAERGMNIMRGVLGDKYKTIHEISEDFSLLFRDADMDDRPKVGSSRIIISMDEFAKALSDVYHSGREVELYEVRTLLHTKAEIVFNRLRDFKKECIQVGKEILIKYQDKFTDYLMKFYMQVSKCLEDLTDLDKSQHTNKLDEFELNKYVGDIIGNLYSVIDDLILEFTMDKREDITDAEVAYITAYYFAINSTKQGDDSTNKYVEFYKRLLTLNTQHKILFEKMKFPEEQTEFKEYVEKEYTNILHSNKTSHDNNDKELNLEQTES